MGKNCLSVFEKQMSRQPEGAKALKGAGAERK